MTKDAKEATKTGKGHKATGRRQKAQKAQKKAGKPGRSRKGGRGDDEATDLEQAWWMRCWLNRALRLYRAPIPSRPVTLAGGHETQSGILILTSTCDLQLRVGESLEYLAMKAFASSDMLGPSGRNNILPKAGDNDFVEIHTDSSARNNVIGISAVFSVRDCSYSYAGGMILDPSLLLIRYGEFVAAASAMLVAIGRGYRNIRINTDCEGLVSSWRGEGGASPEENVVPQLLALKELAESRGISISIRHVKGHGADFGNTMADGLAEMGYAVSNVPTAQEAIDAFGQDELRQAYSETIRLNQRLEKLVRQAEGDIAGEDDGTTSKGKTGGRAASVLPPDGQEGANRPSGSDGAKEDEAIAEAADGQEDRQGDDANDIQPTDRTQPAGRRRHARPAPEPGEQTQGRRGAGRRRRGQSRPQMSIGPATIAICNMLGDLHGHNRVSVNRVDRLVADDKIEKWELIADDQRLAGYARALVSDPSVKRDSRMIDALWEALAKKVGRKVAKRHSTQVRRGVLATRTMLVARLCGVPIEASIDHVLANRDKL